LDANVQSAAERRFYTTLAQEFNDDWFVIHSQKWIGIDSQGRVRDGETDFIVAHPGLGVIVIEVKGGKIRFDEHTGHFFSKSISHHGEGQEHDIKDPFHQAMVCKQDLIRKMKGVPGWPRARVLIGHAVAFIDSIIDHHEYWLRSNAPRTIIIDAADMLSIEQKLRAIFDYWSSISVSQTPYQVPPDIPPGVAGVDAMRKVLYQAGTIRNPCLAESVRGDEQKLARLTEQQYRYLSFIKDHPQVVVEGCAGSGKTFLAIEKARQLAIDEGRRVLFTCYNQGLAHHISKELGYSKFFDVFNFHQLCVTLAMKANLNIPYHDTTNPEYFNRFLPNLLVNAASLLGSQYDAIIADEGQDFYSGWWYALQLLLHDVKEDHFYIFLDDNQRIYHDRGSVPVKGNAYHLDENCRNTQHIGQIVNKFYGGRPTKILGPQGVPVAAHLYKDSRDGKEQLRRLLHKLLNEDGFTHEQIAVLSAVGTQKSDILGERLGNVHLADHIPLGHNEIFATTVRRFKGLERDVIILCEIDKRVLSQDADMLMYIGTSRAKHCLIILIRQDSPQEILDTLDAYVS